MRQYILDNFKHYTHKQVFILSFLSLISSATAIFFAYFSKFTIDNAIAGNMEKFYLFAILLASMIVLQLITSSTQRYLTSKYTQKLYLMMSVSLYDKLLLTNYEYISAYHSEDITNYFKTELQMISKNIMVIFPSFIFNLSRFIGAFVFLFVIDPIFAVIFVGLGTLLLILARLFKSPLKKLNIKFLESVYEKEAHLNETFSHLDIIKTYSDKYSKQVMVNKSEQVYQQSLKKEKYTVFTQLGIQTFYGFGYLFSIVYGAYRITTGNISVGDLTALVQLVQNIQTPFKNVSGLITQYVELSSALTRLDPILKLEADLPQTKLDGFDNLELKNVSFSYDEKTLVLNNLNLRIEPNNVIYLNTPSGSGKTTLFRILLGLYKTEGIFLTYNTLDYPYYEVNQSLTAYVPQASFLFKGSILNNLTLGNPYQQKEIIEATKAAEIYETIISLDNGFDTILQEDGKGLSQGQAQRIAIARALLKNTPILILDEIGASLDYETETKVYENLKRLNKTLLIASHKPLTIPYDKKLDL